MPEPKRISDRQIAALNAIAEAIESVARAYSEWAERVEAKGTGLEVGISDEKPSAVGDCGSCAACDPGLILDGEPTGFPSRMNVCPDCGNKRCPKAANHATWQCSGSNAVGQVGVRTEGAQIDAPVPAERTQGESGDSRTLGDRLRAAADYQDRPGAYDELRAMADEADQLEAARDHAVAAARKASREANDAEAVIERVEALAESEHAHGEAITRCNLVAQRIRDAIDGPRPETTDPEGA